MSEDNAQRNEDHILSDEATSFKTKFAQVKFLLILLPDVSAFNSDYIPKTKHKSPLYFTE